MEDTTRSALGAALAALFEQYEKDRSHLEERMLKNYRQYRGEYDPEIQIDKNRSHAYPKVTRIKCVSTVSRLMQMLFPSSEENWGVEASPIPNMSEADLSAALAEIQDPTQMTDEQINHAVREYAEKKAKAMELEMKDQLKELGGTKELPYVSLCKKVIEHGVRYGVGILKGPLVRTQEQTRWERLPGGQLSVYKVKAYRPYYEVTFPFNYYPDMAAKTFDSMDGEFERRVMNRRQIAALAEVGGFNGDRIKQFLKTYPNGNFRQRSHENQLKQAGTANTNNVDGQGKYELLEFWGEAKAKQLRDDGVEVDPSIEDDAFVEANVWFSPCGIPVKTVVNPYEPFMRPHHQFVFEDDDGPLIGEGLPEIVRDSQLGIAAAARMIVDNASVTAGPQYEVNTHLLAAGQDTRTIHAFKVWERDDDSPATAAVGAIREVPTQSHIPDLLNVLTVFQQFADAETFINPAMNADFANTAKEPYRTAQGTSMLLSGASLPFRDIVRNFDAFTLSVMTSLYRWNMQFNDKPEIKGDYQVLARGTTSLIAKEVRAGSLDQFMMTLTPGEAAYIDNRKIVRERAAVRDLPVEEIPLTDEQARKQQQDQATQAERDRQLQREEIEARIKEILGTAVHKLAQAKKAGAQADQLIQEILHEAVDIGSGDETSDAATRDVVPDGGESNPAAINGSPAPAGFGSA